NVYRRGERAAGDLERSPGLLDLSGGNAQVYVTYERLVDECIESRLVEAPQPAAGNCAWRASRSTPLRGRHNVTQCVLAQRFPIRRRLQRATSGEQEQRRRGSVQHGSG